MIPEGCVSDLVRWTQCFPSENISSLDRLAASLFVSSFDPRSRIMALFTAYFDATGNAKDQPFVVVSGYIASVHQWRMFNGAWIGGSQSLLGL